MAEEIVKMEQAEYMDYLKQQLHDTPEENKKPIAQLTMFDMNKDLVRGLPKMNNMAINNALDKVREWYLDCIGRNPCAAYWALLNHEKHYFTIFTRDRKKKITATADEAKAFITELKDILTHYYGDNDLRAIDVDTNGAIEIWGMWEGEPSVAYLFPYDEGVVFY